MDKNNIDLKEVAYRIRSIRKNLGLSMNDFAERIDSKAKSGTVSNWETGKNLPNNDRLKRIAELGNIQLNELLYGDYKSRIKKILLDKPNVKDQYIDFVINHFTNNHYPREEEVYEIYDTTVSAIEETVQKKVSENLLGYRIRTAEELLYTYLNNPEEDEQLDFIKNAIEQLTEASLNYEEVFEVSIDEVFEKVKDMKDN